MNPTGPIPKKPSDSEDFNYNDVENNDYEEEEDYPQEYEEYEYLINQKKKMFEQEYVSLIPLQKTLSEPNKELTIL